MTLREYGTALRRRWPVVVVGLVVGLLVGGLIALLGPREYRATISVYLSARSADGDVTAAYNGSMLAAQRTTAYLPFLTSERVLGDVVRRLALPQTPQQLAEHVTAAVDPGGSLITATVEDESPVLAAQIANSTAGAFVGLVSELEQPDDRQSPPALRAEILAPAAVPDAPSSPLVGLDIGLGALVGLLLGAGAALLLHAFDPRVRSAQDLAGLTGRRTSTEIPLDPVAVGRSPTAALDEPARAAYRRLRLEVEDTLGADHRVVLISGPGTDQGRTTTAIELALAFAADDRRVALLDADLTSPSIGAALGVEESDGLVEALEGTTSATAAMDVRHGLHVLPGGRDVARPGALLSSRSMAALVGELRDQFDVVVIDGPPAPDALAIARACDGVILVARSGRTKRKDLRATLSDLEAISTPLVGTVLTPTARAARRKAVAGSAPPDTEPTPTGADATSVEAEAEAEPAPTEPDTSSADPEPVPTPDSTPADSDPADSDPAAAANGQVRPATAS